MYCVKLNDVCTVPFDRIVADWAAWLCNLTRFECCAVASAVQWEKLTRGCLKLAGGLEIRMKLGWFGLHMGVTLGLI